MQAAEQDQRKTAARPTHERFRTRVGNRKVTLVGVDPRSHDARRHREVVEDLTAQLGPEVSEVDRLQILNCAAWTVMAERMTAQLVNGEPVDPIAHQRAVNGCERALTRLSKRLAARKPAQTGREALAHHLAAKREASA